MTSLTKCFVTLCLLTSFAAQAENSVTTDMASLSEGEIIGAPQTIPHEITPYLPISADRNACLMCHKAAANAQHKRGEIPLSHLENGKVAGNRWGCLFCHAPMKPIETTPKAP